MKKQKLVMKIQITTLNVGLILLIIFQLDFWPQAIKQPQSVLKNVSALKMAKSSYEVDTIDAILK